MRIEGNSADVNRLRNSRTVDLLHCRASTGQRVYNCPNSDASDSVEKEAIMQVAAAQAAPENVRAFVQEYFDAWKGTDEQKILAYYSDDVVLHLPTGILEGKTAVRDNFVRPFIAAFPGNVHSIRNLAHARNLVAVEWSFEAAHKGTFANIEATGKKVQVPGCSFYEYDLVTRKIPAGRIYFDFATLLRQIGAGA